jgi:hypothetical protein
MGSLSWGKSGRASEPSGFIVQIASVPVLRVTKATRVPSGDQTGRVSSPGEWVTGRASPPLVSAIQISKSPVASDA